MLGGLGSSMLIEIGRVEAIFRYPVKSIDTVREIGRLVGRNLDVRRFRPNVVVRLLRSAPFQEDEWLGGLLSFGERDDAPAITVTMRDVRCSMLNLDPDSATPAPEV